MRPPPFVLGAVLLFWAWRTDLVWAGILAGLLLELPHWIRARWDFTDKELNRLWDVCTLLFIGSAVYLRFSEEVTSAAYKFFQWMPLVLYPMALGYAFNARDWVPAKAFSWLLRRRGAIGADRPVAFGWIYFAVALVTAGATNLRDIWFYLAVVALTGWALWSIRPARVGVVGWCALFLAIAGAGFYAQARMPELQSYVETQASEFLVKFGRRDFDPAQTRTSMGRIGALKQSSRIVLKVQAERGPVPERLRQSTFARLDGTVWNGSARSFEQIPLEADTTTWTLLSNAPAPQLVRIIERVPKKSALLSIPLGTTQLRELAAASVETNVYAVVRASDNPGLLDYLALHGPVSSDLPPREWDMVVPNDEWTAIDQIAREMGIEKLSSWEKIDAIVQFFERNFRYTTFQSARKLGLTRQTPLSEFLVKHRAGHCEYFATATVLLLRYFKIPARYATGYAVHELSRTEGNTHIVRERDGHAWALAYLDGRWVEVDSTPPGWTRAEADEFSDFQGFKDEWERFVFGFLEWRWLGDWNFFRIAAPWLGVPLAVVLIWRIFGRQLKRVQRRIRAEASWPGQDSEYFQLERKLAAAGLGRWNDETTAAWLQRISSDVPALIGPLREVVNLHYRYRFRPEGIGAHERAKLRELARTSTAFTVRSRGAQTRGQ